MTAIDSAAFEQGVLIKSDSSDFRFTYSLFRKLRCIGSSVVCPVFCIDNLRTECSDFKQCIISGIGLDQTTLDTAFKYCSKHKTLNRRNISAYNPHPADAAGIDKSIDNRGSQYDNGQVFFSWRYAAFNHHHDKCGQGADNLPADYNIVSGDISVILIRPDLACRKSKHKLMKIICQDQQQTKHRRNI